MRFFETNLQLFKSALEIIALILNFSDFEACLLCLFLEGLKFLFGHVIKVVLIDSCRAVGESGGHGLILLG